jgi:glycosyltransferase involved in cell wall biosynthesis
MAKRIDSLRGQLSRRQTRVMFLSEIPTPYRLPLYRRLMEEPSLDIEVVFCAAGEPDRPWTLHDELEGIPHRVLRGIHPRVQTKRNTFVYEINPGIVRLLARARPDLLVVGGYAVFAEQMAFALAPMLRVPFLIHSETHLDKHRPGWLSRLKRTVLPVAFKRAAGGLAAGSRAADYLAAHGIPRERIRIFPNTIDVDAYRDLAKAARARATEIRTRRNLPRHFVLFAGRLVEAKGLTDLLAARDQLGADAPPLVVAGTGPLGAVARARPGVHAVGFQDPEALIELYALADWCAVPSRDEPWGVVVNEALACGCPVVATDAVGAAHDLVRAGIDGVVVPAGDVAKLAAALASPPPSSDPSRGPISKWTYDFGVNQFMEAVGVTLSGK